MEVARLEGRVEDAKRHLKTGLDILGRYPSPLEEWKVLKAASLRSKEIGGGDEWQRRLQAAVQWIADRTDDDYLRPTFLKSKLVGG